MATKEEQGTFDMVSTMLFPMICPARVFFYNVTVKKEREVSSLVKLMMTYLACFIIIE